MSGKANPDSPDFEKLELLAAFLWYFKTCKLVLESHALLLDLPSEFEGKNLVHFIYIQGYYKVIIYT